MLGTTTTTTTATTRRNLQDIHSRFHPFTLQICFFYISIRMKINGETTTSTTVTNSEFKQTLLAPPKPLSDPNRATLAQRATVNWRSSLVGVQGPHFLNCNQLILLMVQKSGVHQLSLVVYPIIYGVLGPSHVVVWDVLPSTVYFRGWFLLGGSSHDL